MPRHRLAIALLVVGAAIGAGACSGGDDEPTTAEILATLEGRALTPAEVAAREEVAALLCGLDDEVLMRIWDRLDNEQLEFQDFVFGRQCQGRNSLYGQATGRFAVDGATAGETSADGP